MKKYSLLCVSVLALFILACEDKTETEIYPDTAAKVSSHYVSYERALNTAITFVRDSLSKTRGNNLNVKNHYEYQAHKATHHLDDTIDVRFHVINFSNDAGFTLVSADDRTTPIYAYAEKGNINLEDAMKTTGFEEFVMDAIDYYIYEASHTKTYDTLFSSLIPNPAWVESLPTETIGGVTYYVYSHYETTDSVAPLLLTSWNQNDPYNYYCPEDSNATSGFNGRCPTGCAPIAIAQILAYHKYSSDLTDINGNIIIINWNRLHNQSTFSPGDTSSRGLAKLVRKIGAVANASYHYYGTSVLISNENSTLEHFGYTTSGLQTDATDYSLRLSIKANKPILANGFRYQQSDQTYHGHSWVIDGFARREQLIDYYALDYPHELEFTFHGNCLTYYHCNWGWGGNYNAYVLNFKAYENHEYSFNNSFIYNITPDI